MRIVQSALERIIPSPEARYRRGGAHEEEFILQDGRTVTAPIFDTPDSADVRLRQIEHAPIERDGKEIGFRALVAVSMDGEPPSLAQVRRVNEDQSLNPDLYIGDGTALATSLLGYPDARAEELAQIGISTIQRGEVFSARPNRMSVFDPRRALAAAAHTRRMSLMRRVQYEQTAEARLRSEYDLPSRSIQIGDSQPAVKMPGTAFAAEQLHGAEMVAIQPRAVLAHERIKQEDLMEVGAWIVAQGLGAAALVKDALVHRDEECLKELIRTADLDPAFMIGAVFGSAAAIVNGEHGSHLLNLMRRDMAGCQTIGVRDHLLRTGAKEAWAQFPHIHSDVVDADHLFVASRRAREPQIELLHEMVRLDAGGVNLSQLTDDQKNQLYESNSYTRPIKAVAA